MDCVACDFDFIDGLRYYGAHMGKQEVTPEQRIRNSIEAIVAQKVPGDSRIDKLKLRLAKLIEKTEAEERRRRNWGYK